MYSNKKGCKFLFWSYFFCIICTYEYTIYSQFEPYKQQTLGSSCVSTILILVRSISEIQEYQASNRAPIIIPNNDRSQHVSVNSSYTTVELVQPLHPGNASYSDVAANPNRVSLTLNKEWKPLRLL